MPTSARPPSGGILPECNNTNGLPERSNPGGEAAYAAWVDVGIDPYGLAAQRFVGADAHIGPNPPPAGLLQQIFNLHKNSLNSISQDCSQYTSIFCRNLFDYG